jgi:hypothetical protein
MLETYFSKEEYILFKHYKLVTEWDIQLPKESQTKLVKWRQPTVFMDSTDPFVGYKHQVIVTITDDQSQILLKNEQQQHFWIFTSHIASN